MKGKKADEKMINEVTQNIYKDILISNNNFEKRILNNKLSFRSYKGLVDYNSFQNSNNRISKEIDYYFFPCYSIYLPSLQYFSYLY